MGVVRLPVSSILRLLLHAGCFAALSSAQSASCTGCTTIGQRRICYKVSNVTDARTYKEAEDECSNFCSGQLFQTWDYDELRHLVFRQAPGLNEGKDYWVGRTLVKPPGRSTLSWTWKDEAWKIIRVTRWSKLQHQRELPYICRSIDNHDGNQRYTQSPPSVATYRTMLLEQFSTTTETETQSSKSDIPVAVGSAVAVLLLLALVVTAILLLVRRQRRRSALSTSKNSESFSNYGRDKVVPENQLQLPVKTSKDHPEYAEVVRQAASSTSAGNKPNIDAFYQTKLMDNDLYAKSTESPSPGGSIARANAPEADAVKEGDDDVALTMAENDLYDR